MPVNAHGRGGWQAHRRYLFAVAYRLPGSVSEDAVQETYPAAAPRTG